MAVDFKTFNSKPSTSILTKSSFVKLKLSKVLHCTSPGLSLITVELNACLAECVLSDMPKGHSTTFLDLMFLSKQILKLGLGSKQITFWNFCARGLVHCPMLLPMSTHVLQDSTCRRALFLCNLWPLPASSRKVGSV